MAALDTNCTASLCTDLYRHADSHHHPRQKQAILSTLEIRVFRNSDNDQQINSVIIRAKNRDSSNVKHKKLAEYQSTVSLPYTQRSRLWLKNLAEYYSIDTYNGHTIIQYHAQFIHNYKRFSPRRYINKEFI